MAAINGGGARAYNSGDVKGCVRVYADCIQASLATSLPEGARLILVRGRAAAGAAADWDGRAWALRDALDSLLAFGSGGPQAGARLSFAGTRCRFLCVNDTVMGGRSSSTFSQSPTHASFEGVLSKGGGGGFASCRTAVEWDISSFANMRICVRAKTGPVLYKLVLYDDSDVTWQHDFVVEASSESWRVHDLPLSEFVPSWRGQVQTGKRLDRSAVRGVGLMVSFLTDKVEARGL